MIQAPHQTNVPLQAEPFPHHSEPSSVDITSEMWRIVYPSATLYLSPPSDRQLTRPVRTKKRLQDEIRYVTTGDIDFLVDPQSMAHDYLTQAETMSLVWVGLGKTVTEAASELGNSPSTCRMHREKLFWKLGATSMVQAVACAFDLNLLAPVPDRAYQPLVLTPREQTVLSVLGTSKTKEEVATKLHVSRSTVHTHTYHVLKANAITHCAHAILRAHLAGQLPLDKKDD